MCLMAYASKDRSQISNDHLRNAHNTNDDAWGIMFPDSTSPGRLSTMRGLNGHDEFRTAWSLVPFKTPVCVHFRYATSGLKDESMCHPFMVLNYEEHGVDLAVMHNGVLSIHGTKDGKSDTAILVDSILRPVLVSDPNLIESETWRTFVGQMISNAGQSDNKLLFMRGDGQTWIVNQQQGLIENGVWFSNKYSLERGGLLGFDWNDWMDSRYGSSAKPKDSRFDWSGYFAKQSGAGNDSKPPLPFIAKRADTNSETHVAYGNGESLAARRVIEVSDDYETDKMYGYKFGAKGEDDSINGIPVTELSLTDLADIAPQAIETLCEYEPYLASQLLLDAVHG